METTEQEDYITREESTKVPFEYAVFALAFKEPGAIAQFVKDLPAGAVGAVDGSQGMTDFYNALVDYHSKTGLDPVDPTAFKSWLQSETEIYEALGGSILVDELIGLIQGQADLPSVESAVQILKWRANKRRQMDLMQELQALVLDKKHKTDEEVLRLHTLTEEIRKLEDQLDYDPLAGVSTATSLADGLSDDILVLPDFLPTPFKALNKAMGYTETGGFYRGAVHAVLAESGKGKSTFAKCLCNHWLDEGKSVLFVNFEEVEQHWNLILMSQILKKNVYAQATSWTDGQKKENIAEFKDTLRSWGDRLMVKHDPESIFFDDLERWLRDIVSHNAKNPDVVVIDTIQSMFTKGGGKQRWQQFEEMMVRLEQLAKDMDCVLIITAQQNANAMKEKREVIKQSDTGGSISIQQKSAVTIFLTPQNLESGQDDTNPNLMQLQIPKNRITGSSHSYDPPIVLYNDETKSYEDFELPDDALYTQSLSDEDFEGYGEIVEGFGK